MSETGRAKAPASRSDRTVFARTYFWAIQDIPKSEWAHLGAYIFFGALCALSVTLHAVQSQSWSYAVVALGFIFVVVLACLVPFCQYEILVTHQRVLLSKSSALFGIFPKRLQVENKRIRAWSLETKGGYLAIREVSKDTPTPPYKVRWHVFPLGPLRLDVPVMSEFVKALNSVVGPLSEWPRNAQGLPITSCLCHA